jgi:hypothetical protein
MQTISGRGVMVMVGVIAILACSCRRDAAPAPAQGPTADEGAPRARGASPPARPAAEAPPAPAEAAPGEAPAVAALLTDQKVKGYLAWQREVAAGAKGIGGMIGAAAPRVRKGEAPAVNTGDPAMQGLGNAGERGLAKSGMPQEEITALARVLTSYYTQRMMAVDAAGSLAKAKGPVMAGIFKKQVEQGDKVRADFEKKHGKAALAVVDKHEKEALEIQSLLLKNALGGRK